MQCIVAVYMGSAKLEPLMCILPTAADTNLLRIPDSDPDEKWLFLSDILPTAWWATELANVQEGDVAAIWGSGPGEKLLRVCTGC